jgi:hypothetical protein
LRHLELEAGAVAIEVALEREVGSWPPLLDQLPDITVRRRRWRRDAKRFTISGTQEVEIERGANRKAIASTHRLLACDGPVERVGVEGRHCG